MSLLPLRKQEKKEHEDTELRLQVAERVALNHAIRLRRLEAEVGILKLQRKGRPE